MMLPGFYRACWIFAVVFFKITTRWRVKGRENVPGKGPVLVVSNHLNLVDPFILGISINREVRFMAKGELFSSRFVSFILRSGLGAFPVSRGQFGKEVFRKAIQVLARGEVLAMFPEGRRSRDVQLRPALPGFVLIALRSGAPILPVGMYGTEQCHGLISLLPRPKITVNIGPPFYLPQVSGNEDKLDKAERMECINIVMCRIAELLPPEYRGAYASKVGKTE